MTVALRRARTSLALTAALLAALTACGGSQDPTPDDAGPTGGDPASQALIEKVNEAMRTTTFHSSGTTTAFAEGDQETTWDPDKGLRTVASGTYTGEMYCKDGVNYLSSGLLAASLGQSGRQLDVPEALADKFVYTDTGQQCTAMFSIDPSGRLTPDKDTEVDGRPTKAVTVEGAGGSDVYQVAASGTPYILQLVSDRGGRTSTTTFDAFGEPTDITMPPDSLLVPLEDFQKQATPAE
ncbi:hypothetical protein [Streptomyces chumphonensis]|uniref:hypothetical protein n=1 Tax=Streptomyces chumphonensis TaxID=1214925 RepID=UPI003D7589BA